MANIKVSPEELDTAGNQFHQAYQTSNDMIKNLDSKIKSFEGQWEGTTKANFFSYFESAKKLMDNYLIELDKIEKDLKAIAKRFRDADGQH